jgi:hypothetical protein
MRIPARAKLTWLLATVLTVMAGAGEGLHLLPGCGHAVEIPGGLLYLGIDAPEEPLSSRDGNPTCGSPEGDSPLILDEDECAICSVCAQSQSRAKAVQFVFVLLVAQSVPEVAPGDIYIRTAESFDARAPPAA